MGERKSVSILGATGSVGQSTLDLIGRAPEDFDVVALTAYSDVPALAAAARTHGAKLAVIGDASLYADLKAALIDTDIDVAAGADAVIDAAKRPADWTMAAIVGCAGLMPTMAALERGKCLAFANKESLVSAGPQMMAAARASGATLLPVDSEHNAIFQCLDQSAPKGVARLILTASGGPFRTASAEMIENATPEQALKHPNWSMGAKITIDSATMMNKGLELIEAHYLFAMPSEQLDVLFHPQSVIHSLVEYVDGSVLAQLGAPDMRIPIAHCLAWPERMATPMPRLNLAEIGRLDFEAPDLERFPVLRIAREAMEAGGARPATLNAANEVAVAAFLARRIRFGAIAAIVAATLDRYSPTAPASLDDVLSIDSEARRVASCVMESEFA
ncbi:MAG: 1-deoxy-D-xylulose-5-phosphate reductoisomerase [Sphingomonadaceae bacterium]